MLCGEQHLRCTAVVKDTVNLQRSCRESQKKKKKNQDSDFTTSLPSDLLPMLPCELEQSGKSRENGGWGEGGG